MSETKLKAGLPKDDEANGLAGSSWANRLLDDPTRSVVAVVTLQAATKTTDFGAGKVSVGVQVTAIEPVLDEAEAGVLADKLLALRSDRLGGVKTPLDVPPEPEKSNVTKLGGAR